METNDEKIAEEFMPVAESVTSDGKTYKVKLGDTWASLAEHFGYTKKFPTLQEAIHAIKEAAGYGSKLNDADMPKEIKLEQK